MPGSNLTRIEAEERKAVIEAPIHYHVDLDLTVGAKNFGSKTRSSASTRSLVRRPSST